MTKPLKRPPTKGTRRGNGAGKGEGWGGPAKGFAKKTERPKFEPGNAAAVGRSAPDRERILSDQEKARALRDHLFFLSLNAERQETQRSACESLLNRIEGMPVARTELTGADGAPVALTAIRRVIVDPKSEE
jgi:hypothetical protein